MKDDVVQDSGTAAKHVEDMANKMVNKITGKGGIVESINSWDSKWGDIYNHITS
jgi:hypothetical protein